MKAVSTWAGFKRKNGIKPQQGLSASDSARRSLLLETQSAEVAVRADANAIDVVPPLDSRSVLPATTSLLTDPIAGHAQDRRMLRYNVKIRRNL